MVFCLYFWPCLSHHSTQTEVCCSTPYRDVPSISPPPPLSHQEVSNNIFSHTPGSKKLILQCKAAMLMLTDLLKRWANVCWAYQCLHCCFDMAKRQKCIFKGLETHTTKSLPASAEAYHLALSSPMDITAYFVSTVFLTLMVLGSEALPGALWQLHSSFHSYVLLTWGLRGSKPMYSSLGMMDEITCWRTK